VPVPRRGEHMGARRRPQTGAIRPGPGWRPAARHGNLGAMGMPERRRCFDTMLGLPPDRENWRQALGTLIRDPGSAGLRQPAGYMFRDLPEVPEPGSYEEYLLAEMDRWDVEAGLIPVGATEDDLGRHLVRKHPDRLYGSVALDPHDPIGSVGRLRKGVADLGVRAATVFP